MKVVICNLLYPPLGIGGAERSVEGLAEGLIAKGCDVTVISRGTGFFTTRETISKVKVIRLGSNPGYHPNIYNKRTKLDDFWAKIFPRTNVNKQMANEIFKVKPDIVHTNVIGAPHGLWKAMKSNHIPTVHTIRNHSLICRQHMYKNGSPCKKQCESCFKTYQSRREGTKFIDNVVGISEYILNRHKENGYFQNTNSYVVPNSYECEIKDIKRKKSKNKKLIFGYLGRLHHPKGIELFIDAAKKFKNENMEFHIAGTGNPEYVEYLKESAKGYPNIRFLGFMNTIDFFKNMDVLIVPSLLVEPFGRSYIEALAHGVPVIGAGHGGALDIIDKETGWLFNPGDIKSLCDKILEAKSSYNDIDEYSSKCILSANKYLPDRITEQYINIYLKCLK